MGRKTRNKISDDEEIRSKKIDDLFGEEFEDIVAEEENEIAMEEEFYTDRVYELYSELLFYAKDNGLLLFENMRSASDLEGFISTLL